MDSYHVDVPDDERTDFMCIFSFLGPLHVPISFYLSFARRLSEISGIGTLPCYDAFEELRHDSFLHNGFEPPELERRWIRNLPRILMIGWVP